MPVSIVTTSSSQVVHDSVCHDGHNNVQGQVLSGTALKQPQAPNIHLPKVLLLVYEYIWSSNVKKRIVLGLRQN